MTAIGHELRSFRQIFMRVFFSRSLVAACNVWQAACAIGISGANNCSYSILSNRILVVLDLLNTRLNVSYYNF